MNEYQNYAKLTSMIFKNLFTIIAKPSIVVPHNYNRKNKPTITEIVSWYRRTRKWLQEVSVWTHEEKLWFGAYEEFLDYDEQSLKNRIIEKIEDKIKDLDRSLVDGLIKIKKEEKNARLSATNKKE